MKSFTLAQFKWYLKSPTIRFTVLVSFLITLGLPYYLSLFEENLNGRLQALSSGAFQFPIIYNTVANIQYYFNYLFGVAVVIIVSAGFEKGTYKLAIMNGRSKRQLWVDSIRLVAVLSALLFLVCFLLSVSIGLFKDPGNFTLSGFKWIFIYFFQTVTLLSYAVTFGLIFKHSGSAVLAYLIWFPFAERVIAQILEFNFKLYPVFRFLPGKVVEDLVHMIAATGFFIQRTQYLEYKFVAAALWLAVSLGLNCYFYKKADYVK